MKDPKSVAARIENALECLCLKGDFKTRLEGATQNALIHLEKDTLPGNFCDDLNYILDKSKGNIHDGKIIHEFSDDEIRDLYRKMIRIVIEFCPGDNGISLNDARKKLINCDIY